MTTPADNVKRIQVRIANAAIKSGRKPEAVTLIAVTKTVPLERVKPVVDAGIRNLGENRVQEALSKFAGLAATFHLIGPLQSNKARKAVSFFHMIQSLDRLDLAQDLNRYAQELGKKQDCLVQVKISSEETKSGVPPDQLAELLDQLRGLPNLSIRGLMGIPPLTATGDAARPYFQKLRRLFDDNKGFTILSMGMSSDFEAALEEGSTMVRVGAAIFGERSRLL